jgi:integrase/recombinase XerD
MAALALSRRDGRFWVRGRPWKPVNFVSEKISMTALTLSLPDVLPPDGPPRPGPAAERAAAIGALVAVGDPGSLCAWVRLYWNWQVSGASVATLRAKRSDLARFVTFFVGELQHDSVDGWTPAISRHFQAHLLNKGSSTGGRLAATSVNRICATVRHFGAFVHGHRALPAGPPFGDVRDVSVDEPAWYGLSATQLARLRAACELRLAQCRRKNQNPLLEAAVFYVLLHTGLRESELVALDFAQYHHRGLHEVRRKARRVTRKVHVPSAAAAMLERYLDESRGRAPGPLFVARGGERLTVRGVAYICERLARQASTHAKEGGRFHLTPHMLRHTYLKRAADQHGVHVAQKLSGNVSMREVFRYTKPSDAEAQQTAEGLFN